MLQTGKTQRMLQIFDKSFEFEWKIFEIFIILFSFFISPEFGLGCLKVMEKVS